MTEQSITGVLVERDLFFVMKIRPPFEAMGWTLKVAKTDTLLQQQLAEETPDIVIVRFGIPNVQWESAIMSAAANHIPVLAYGSHEDIAAQTLARAAGATRVITNGKLSQDVTAQVRQTIAKYTTHESDSLEED